MLSENQRKSLHGQDYVNKFINHQNSERIDRLLGLMNLNNEMQVLDIGCGNGMLLNALHLKIKNYVGVDFSQPFIDIANKSLENLLYDNAEFICADINEYCKKNTNRFDAAFALDLSEHVYDDEFSIMLTSIRASLKSGGTFYLHTPNLDFFIERFKEHNIILEQFPEHIAVRTVDEYLSLFKNAGYSDIKVQYLPHYNILKLLHPLSYFPFVGKYFQARLFISAEK